MSTSRYLYVDNVGKCGKISNMKKITTIYKTRIEPTVRWIFFLICAFVLFLNFVVFIKSNGQDALALAWIAFSSLFMHEEHTGYWKV